MRSVEKISYGDSVEIRLSGLEQIVCVQQTNAILAALHKIAKVHEHFVKLKDVVDSIELELNEKESIAVALDHNTFDGTLARPRKYEIAATLNRLRLPNILQRK